MGNNRQNEWKIKTDHLENSKQIFCVYLPDSDQIYCAMHQMGMMEEQVSLYGPGSFEFDEEEDAVQFLRLLRKSKG
ncbi:MAG: hypothetical protein PHI02_06335 [Sulfurovaceae bacterium]|nr:hypothetical protein [Sulfurovaceae bacterium]